MKRLGLAGLLLASQLVFGQEGPAMMKKEQSGIELAQYDPQMCVADGVAVGGFDLVSYRAPAGPQPGQPDFSTEYQGRTYLFVDQQNLDAFLANPAYYLPQYGGFCAITLALGRLTCPDYTNFKIEDNRLLLFETTGFTNGRVVWDTDPSRYRQQADLNYSGLHSGS